MRTWQSALNWARKMGWLRDLISIDLFDVDDDGEMIKGRPLTDAEFKRMLAVCDTVCPLGVDSWTFLLRGLWESGLRLGEAMNLSWDDDSSIIPLKTRRGGYLLKIPAGMQKNRKSQEVPTTPDFAALLDKVANDDRLGWTFNPSPRRPWNKRLGTAQVGRIISDIGEAANVMVNDENKPASADDLRRSFGQRMADAGLPPRDLQSIMRHSNLATTEKYFLRHRVAEQADRIAMYLGTPRRIDVESETKGSTQVVTT